MRIPQTDRGGLADRPLQGMIAATTADQTVNIVRPTFWPCGFKQGAFTANT